MATATTTVITQLPPAAATPNVLSARQENGIPFTMPPFDPAIHLAFEPPTARHSFTELGLKIPHNTPDMCFTEPFQLFSEEGVRMIRRDLLRKEVLDEHLKSWDRAPAYIGGHEDVRIFLLGIISRGDWRYHIQHPFHASNQRVTCRLMSSCKSFAAEIVY